MITIKASIKLDKQDNEFIKELHSWLKETGMKYRVDVPDTSMFRILRSKKSLVDVIDNFAYH